MNEPHKGQCAIPRDISLKHIIESISSMISIFWLKDITMISMIYKWILGANNSEALKIRKKNNRLSVE